MNKEDLLKLKEELSKLSYLEQQRDLYLKKFYNGEILGPMTGYPSIDKPWLKYHTNEAVSRELEHITIYEKLINANKDNMDKVALNYFGRKIAYAELINNIEVTSANLLNMGVKTGDIVSIAAPTTPEVIYLIYALSKIGATANMIDPRTSVEGIKNYINETNSELLFIVDVASPKVKDIKVSSSVKKVVSISPADSLPPIVKQLYNLKEKIEAKKQGKTQENYGFDKWPETMKNSFKEYCGSTAAYDEERPAVIVHTGGTTGNPKGVMLNDFSLNAAAQQCIEAGFDFKRDHSWMNIMPPFIAYGVGNGLHLPLICGMEVIIVPAFEAKKFADLLAKHKPNHMTGAPSPYEFVINNKKMKKADLSYMIAPTVGGDKMDETLERQTNDFLAAHGCEYKVVKGYGMTEVNAAVAACSNNEINKIGTVGLPFAKENIAIFNPGTEEEVLLGEIGEVCITGPNTMLGYYNNPKATNEVLKKHADGKLWMHSGDIGYFDKDGQLYILDRIKRMVIRYDGFKLFPSVIENVISSVEGVKNVSVIGVPDEGHTQGKLPYAFITIDENADESIVLSNISQKCEAELPEYSQLCGMRVIDEIPYTGIGKVDFRTLEEQYGAKTLQLKK